MQVRLIGYVEFLWSGEEGKKKSALVAWKTICRDKKEGGLGISQMTIVSEALWGKMAWWLATKESKQWIDVCRRKYLQKDNPFLRVENLPYGSPFWNGLVQVQKNINRYITWRVGNGKDTYFWEYTWLREQPLAEYEDLKKIAKWIMRKQDEKVSNYLSKDGQNWIFSKVEVQPIKDQLQKIKDEITKKGITRSKERDRPNWKWAKSGSYNVKGAIRMLQIGDVFFDQDLWLQV